MRELMVVVLVVVVITGTSKDSVDMRDKLHRRRPWIVHRCFQGP